MEHRDSPDIEPERTETPRSSPGRHFARLVGSPAARKVALPRLIIAGVVALGLVALLVIGGSRLLQSVARWVDRRPEHQILFSQIELVPEPPPCIKGGKAKILAEVRKEAKLDATVSLLDLNLKDLEQDFRRCSWIKDVRKVDRSHHGRLIVELIYRQPVAVVEYDKLAPGLFVLDDEAVVLNDEDIDWASTRDPYRPQGITSPLIKIKDLPASMPPPILGLPWKQRVDEATADDRDPMMLRAARLARFLSDRKLALKSPDEAPNFVSIYLPHGPDKPFFLRDADQNGVFWGKAPGDEKPGEPTSEERWKMLLDWVKLHGPLVAKNQDYLRFTSTGAELYRPPARRGSK